MNNQFSLAIAFELVRLRFLQEKQQKLLQKNTVTSFIKATSSFPVK